MFNHVGGRLRPAPPISVPRSHMDGATTRSARTVSVTHSSTVCRKLRTMTNTPIIIANPTINAETVTPFRPGLRDACSTAIPLMTPWTPPSRPTYRRRREPSGHTDRGEAGEPCQQTIRSPHNPKTGMPPNGPRTELRDPGDHQVNPAPSWRASPRCSRLAHSPRSQSAYVPRYGWHPGWDRRHRSWTPRTQSQFLEDHAPDSGRSRIGRLRGTDRNIQVAK